jgi:hydroxyacyl-ACP dehydratase HTD2-like protein with hotdog domain
VIKETKKPVAVSVGEKLPIVEKRFAGVDLVAYGAATWDWHRLHYDLEYARSRNLPGVIVDGQAFGALLARAALDWAGPRAFIRRLSFKMKSMAFAGDTLRAEGEVAEVHQNAVVLSQRLMNGKRVAAEAVTEIRLAE